MSITIMSSVKQDRTFLSLEAVAKYLSSCDQQHDQMILECTQVFLSTPATLMNIGSEMGNTIVILFSSLCA